MSVELGKLIAGYPGEELTLVAGRQGMKRLVSWVQICETPDSADFLSGGEVIVVTGIGLRADHIEEDAEQLLLALKRKLVSAVIMYLGKYIKEVPQTALTFAERENMPLYTLPWEVPLETVTQPLCTYIVQDSVHEETVRTAFKNAIFFPDQQDRYVVPLAEHHFRVEDRYAIIMLRVEGSTQNPYRRAEDIKNRLSNHLKTTIPKSAVFTDDLDILAVVSTEHTDDVRKLAEDLKEHARYLLPMNKEKLYIGIGKLTRSIRCIYKSYKQAAAIIGLQMKKTIPANRVFFTDMGPYRLLLGIEDDEIKQEYYDEVLGPLQKHDTEKGSDLTEVLRTYLMNDGSITKTAERMFVHRNTVNYKLNQVSKILDINLGSLETRVQLLLAFWLHEML